jgi:hypothetical protein
MSRLSDAHAYGAFPAAPARAGALRRIVLLIAVVLAAATAVVAGQDAVSVQVARAQGPDLVRLLRFLAGVKDVAALGAAALAWWRLGYAARPGIAAATVAAAAVLGAGSGLIWCMGHIIAGSALFYAGLIGLAGVAAADRAATGALLARLVGQRGTTGTATSLRRNGGSVHGGS